MSELFAKKPARHRSPNNIQLARSRSPEERKEIVMVSKHSGDAEDSDGFEII